ncbi:BZ3500_MvSof-1268-A1-R1_Chr3-1g06147 [Microbotryum saponariae]|uniref:BZ3500_MvSof-1268-A1-R1_Chr3-1g06147 protein n=1 Tax=Microbotryum saponariae TaxID=289078 RepID=A0A2X0LFZ0_9BASI|nr:BZ3500_MvSof-1268-A1-R1_Chr3-1g06147 [Microbotryum saponariae]SDA04010.1 BZ3501_MvSof-1269-A2-R1_Chr3-2g05832 [Microbotryum saponariae]
MQPAVNRECALLKLRVSLPVVSFERSTSHFRDGHPSSDNPNYQHCVLKVCKGRNRYCTIYQAQSKNAAACMKSLPAGSSVAG